MSPVYLHGASYLLGEIDAEHTTIANLAERAEQFKLPPKASLWGWGQVRRTERPLEAMAIDSGLASLAAAGVAAESVDALVFCSTSIVGPADDHGRLFQAVLHGIGLSDIAFYGLTLNRCTNLLAGIDLASALVAAGRYRRVLVITTDLVLDEADRMVSYALFSDGAASCIVDAEARADGYQIVACANAQDAGSLEWTKEISSDLARVVDAKLLDPAGLALSEVCGLMHLNIFKPLVTMKERQAGFSAAQLYTDNIERTGHCFAADPLINLVDRAGQGAVHPGHYYLLAASVPGSRFGVLLRKLMSEGA
ncbi:MAG: 3-oxoacyl-ACP synthase [Actinomycetota bacterium]|nr:3-oxoacyl-ACP synthase [Actinomycetota bacterium]